MSVRPSRIALAAGAALSAGAASAATTLELTSAQPATTAQIDVISYRWGSAEAAATSGMRVAPQRLGPAAGTLTPRDSGAAEVSRQMLRGEKISLIPYSSEVATAREAGSGQAEGKRRYEPPPSGSLTVRPSAPWAGCAVGLKFDGAALVAGSQRYDLSGVEVAGCAADGVTINYAGYTPPR